MIIDLKTSSQEPRHYDLSLAPDWWVAGDDPIVGLDGPLKAHLTVYRAGSKFVLEGRLSGRLILTCDRCLETYGYALETSFRLFLSPPPAESDRSEIELMEEDLALDFLTADEIQVEDVIREQVFLSLPMKFLCREDCAGLCPVCGSDLNRNKCGCRQGEGHPGFAKLKKLKMKSNED
jgi:uncharacterized protein